MLLSVFIVFSYYRHFWNNHVFLSGLCGVIEQKDEGGQQPDTACGTQTQPGHAGLCEYDA